MQWPGPEPSQGLSIGIPTAGLPPHKNGMLCVCPHKDGCIELYLITFTVYCMFL